MIYDRHPELQSKWNKAFWARGYVETIGNITDEAVQRYIKEQAEESLKEDMRSVFSILNFAPYSGRNDLIDFFQNNRSGFITYSIIFTS